MTLSDTPFRGQGHTPVMQQFFRAKEQYPDAIVFFRMGDFYEMFFEDAEEASALLELTLTSRSKGSDGERIPMAGVPHHAASGYIAQLLERGRKVAVCEQMADPSTVKGVVPRSVVRVITPGLCLDPNTLDARAHNFLVALSPTATGEMGFAAFELSTADLRAGALPDTTALVAELARMEPREVLVPEEAGIAGGLYDLLSKVFPRIALRRVAPMTAKTAAAHPAFAHADVARVFADLAESAQAAVGLAVHYASEAQPLTPLVLERLVTHDTRAHLVLDEAAVRNLELVRTLGGERKGSLLHWLDETRSPMGARLLRERLLAPATDLDVIRARHARVAALVADRPLRAALRESLAEVGDIERLVTRAVHGVATPRDLASVRDGLAAAARVMALLPSKGKSPLKAAPADDLCEDLAGKLAASLQDEPPFAANAGGIVREGVRADLDELRGLARNGKDVILELEARERTATGIGSLKIKYTRVFGYYIEITKSNLKSTPSHYRRRQTIANGERYTTDELDVLQEKVLGAEERSHAIEAEMFQALRSDVARQATRVQRLARRLAALDVDANFAEVAERYDYACPVIDDGVGFELVESRHPVVERTAASGTFVPNDVRLDADGARLMIITGPNMAGKSTVMRQAALAIILGQAGGFVPAKSAHFGVVDRVHTRVGASDNLSRGQSTFMVEMSEAATILRDATRRSFVLLDEVGRGTSTYDGVAIAWSIAEHLHDSVRCRTLFATHYHELCDLSDSKDGVMNFNVSAKEQRGDIVFLHRLLPGSASKSYGVEVARYAGLPAAVVARARALLHELEAANRGPSSTGDVPAPTVAAPSPIETAIAQLDLDRTTPVEALVALTELQREIRARTRGN